MAGRIQSLLKFALLGLVIEEERMMMSLRMMMMTMMKVLTLMLIMMVLVIGETNDSIKALHVGLALRCPKAWSKLRFSDLDLKSFFL